MILVFSHTKWCIVSFGYGDKTMFILILNVRQLNTYWSLKIFVVCQRFKYRRNRNNRSGIPIYLPVSSSNMRIPRDQRSTDRS